MKLLRVIVAALAISVQLPSSAQTLWKDSVYGMTEVEVMKVNPSAVKTKKGSSLPNGAVQTLEVQNIEIVKRKFTAGFYFKDQKLNQITLSLNKGSNTLDASSKWDELYLALSAKYGKELSKKSQDGILKQKLAEWTAGKTNIQLLFLAVGEKDPILQIAYHQGITQDAEKL